MHRSRSFLALVAGCFLAAASAFATTVREVRQFVAEARDFVLGAAKAVVEKFEQPSLRLLARPVELVQACAYALGLAKRERPHVRSQWRMCPSI